MYVYVFFVVCIHLLRIPTRSNVVSYKGNGKRHATERRQKGSMGHSVLTLVFPGSSSSQKGKLKHAEKGTVGKRREKKLLFER